MLFTEDLSLLDFRLIRAINNEKQLKVYLSRLPLIVACSIKTRNDEATFKAEYIIPQILLHTILNKKGDIDGIIYSSMRKDYEYFKADQNVVDCAKNENVVIPAKVTYDNHAFSDNLLKMMEISQPLNYEQELIKGSISLQASNQYEETIFGQMERLIMSTKIYKAGETNKLSLQNVNQRMKELKASIYIK